MNRLLLRAIILILLVVWLAPSATAQFAQIQQIPNQGDHDNIYTSGAAVVEAPNGDVLAFIVESGERTNNDFPPEGTPAELIIHRTTDGGTSWEAPVTMRTGLDTYGLQGIGPPYAAVLPSGRIVVIFWYMLDVSPNFDSTVEIHVSDDSGETWSLLDTRGRDIAGLSVTPSGTLLSIDWMDDGEGNLSFWWSTSANGGETWTTGGFLADFGPICGQDIVALTDTDWAFVSSDCNFTDGGIVHLSGQTTTDAGATWSDPVEFGTAGSRRFTGSNIGSVVRQPDGSIWLAYRDGTTLAYRTGSFEDGDLSFSSAMSFTVGTEASSDFFPECGAASSSNPVCLFRRRVDGRSSRAYHIGVLGTSADPLSGATAAEEGSELPSGLTISANYPNPFNGRTTIEYELTQPGDVRLSVFNLLGEEVARLTDGHVEAGAQRAVWNADGLPGGVYLIRLTSGGSSVVRPATLLR